MTTHSQAISRYFEIMLGNTTRKSLASTSVFSQGDTLYSYGRHFTLCRAIRGKARKGQTAPVELFLLNGDTYSNTTSRHQSHLRNELPRSVPSVIIPFTALTMAGIDDPGSVRLVEATSDRMLRTDHVTYEQPPRSKWETRDVTEWVNWTEVDQEAAAFKLHVQAQQSYLQRLAYAHQDKQGRMPGKPGYLLKGRGFWERWAAETPPPVRKMYADHPSYQFRNGYPRKIGETRHLMLGWQEIKRIEQLDDGRTRYSWTTERHLLGESLITAEVRYNVRKKCTGCKWDDAARDVASGEHRDWCKGTVSTSRTRRAYFLSGFDANESRPSYFFCELPPGVKPTTVAEAYETLKPPAVAAAESMGRTVQRQGDIYAIPLAVTTRQLTKAGGVRTRAGRVFNTNHVATETIVLDGQTYGRGHLTHKPAGRAPDHARIKLGDGKTFHLLVKNMVPTAR